MEFKFMTKRLIAGAAGAAAMMLAAGAQAALLDRDLDGDTVVDAFYDTDLDITWLRDANVSGYQKWADARSWADGFSFGGYSDWRLPTSDECGGLGCTGSEMGHLWYVDLGNPAGGPMTNTGGFQNLESLGYWSGTPESRYPTIYAWAFYTTSGEQGAAHQSNSFLAMAVADGDVALVPEPQTYALMLAGIAGLALATWHRQR